MATRSPRSTTPKTAVATSAAKKTTARSTSSAASGSKSKTAAPAEPAAPTPPPAPKPVTVSLIDDKPKPERKRSVSSLRPFKALPSISKLLEPEPPEVTPEELAAQAAEIAEIAAAEAAAAAETEAAAKALEAPEPVAPVDDKVVHLKPPIGVRDLAAALKLKPFEVIRDLMGMNIFVNLNQTVDVEIASAVCKRHGYTFEREKREKGAGVHKQVEKIVEPPKVTEKVKAAELKLRPPIVAFLGHVDHGKTTLMDAIRKARVAAGEAGGITQHIGAYSVSYKDHSITFLDTPGHAAFTAMRARGANVTDIVVLVVAADDGIMPQTVEALAHARAAKVQIIVAITKTDTNGANIDRVKGQLQEKGLSPEDWGGETICVPVAALKGVGVDTLLENILLVSEVAELKATEGGVARATVIEAQLEQGRGPTATLIVRTGTLKVGDAFICGNFSGKIKGLLSDSNKPIKSASASTPVKVVGFAGLPNAGDELVVMESEKAASILSEERINKLRLNKLAAPSRPTLENLFQSIADENRKSMRVIVKADVQGSSEALVNSLKQIQSKKIDLEILHSAVGPITENDVLLAAASNAIVIGFNVKVENNAAGAAKREGVQVKLYSIIYELLDQVKEAMAGMLDPESRESVVGHAEVRRVFDLTKGCVAGSYVTDGRIIRSGRARVLRGRQAIYDGGLSTLRRFTDDVKEVRNGMECGIKLGNFDEYEEGDIIECYVLEKVAQQL